MNWHICGVGTIGQTWASRSLAHYFSFIRQSGGLVGICRKSARWHATTWSWLRLLMRGLTHSAWFRLPRRVSGIEDWLWHKLPWGGCGKPRVESHGFSMDLVEAKGGDGNRRLLSLGHSFRCA